LDGKKVVYAELSELRKNWKGVLGGQ
jgi:hypothetical protein